MEQPKAMEYGNRKMLPDILKLHIYIYMSVTVSVTLRWVVLVHVHQLPQQGYWQLWTEDASILPQLFQESGDLQIKLCYDCYIT